MASIATFWHSYGNISLMKPIPQVSRHDPVRVAIGLACGQWLLASGSGSLVQRLPHSGQLMAAIKMLSTKHLPHWHLLPESRRNGARTWQMPRGEIGCNSRSGDLGLLHLGSQLQFGYAEAESNHNLKTLFGHLKL